MTHDEKEIKRKLRILKHAEYSGNIAKTCRYFGVVWLAHYSIYGATLIENLAKQALNGNGLFQNPIPDEPHLR